MIYSIVIIAVITVVIVLLEIRNHRMREFYGNIEWGFADVLDGRFAGKPLLRRRFVRALALYAGSEGGNQHALSMFQKIQRQSEDIGDQAACLIMTGMCLEELNDNDNAMRAYDSVRAALKDYKLGYVKRAHLLSKLGKPESVAAYAEIIEKFPGDAVQRNNFASALIKQNRCGEAIVQLKKALSLDEKLLAARGMLALAYARLGDAENAERAFRDAVEHGDDAEELRAIIDAEFSKQR